jgi:streptomycin 6-kinase
MPAAVRACHDRAGAATVPVAAVVYSRAAMSGFVIPDEVVQMIGSAGGEAGRAWLAAVPGIVGDLAARWELTLGPPFEGGCVAWVAPAERADGTSVVLKVSFVDEETRHEADALALWDGQGAVRLLDAEPERGAMLLERLRPGTSLFDHPDLGEAVSIACGVLRRLWRPLPADHPFMPVRDLARRWMRELPVTWERLGRPFERALVDEAVADCAEFAEAEELVLVNRDFHLGNVLAAEREPWLAIDPKPLAGERVFDTGHLLRSSLGDHPDQATVDHLVGQLAAELDVDGDRIRAWALVRSVEDALWGLEAGGTDLARDTACARLLRRGPAGRSRP